MRLQVIVNGRLLTVEVSTDGLARVIKSQKYKGPKCPLCGGRGIL